MGENWKEAVSVYDFNYVDINGNPESMKKFEYVLLIMILYELILFRVSLKMCL